MTVVLNSSEKEATVPARPVHPGVAACLSLICVGAGQCYAGRPLRGLLVVALTFVLLLGVGFLLISLAPQQPIFDCAFWCLPLVLHGLNVWDAYRCARRGEARRSHAGLCLAYIAAIWVIPSLGHTRKLFDALAPVHSYYIPSSSMIPTLQVGDYLVTSNLGRKPKRGDVVVFRPPAAYSGNKEDLIKRIVAVGGDEVEVREGALWINGAKQAEPYAREPIAEDFEKKKVSPGEFFMLGDNRNDSFDSRYWGSVPAENIKGRAVRIIWSQTPGRMGRGL